MKILAFSDIHGNVDAVKKLVTETESKEYDLIIFGGDFTNSWFDGPEIGQQQMEEVIAVIETLDRPFYFVLGNRDIFFECNYGYNIGDNDQKIGEYILTNNSTNLNKQKILVTHILEENFMNHQANSLLYLYGHDHIGRIYKNYIDLGFLYRGTKAHGAREAGYGCYWFIEINNGKVTVENNCWDLRESTCDKHPNQGIFYIPYYYRRNCMLCYDEKRNRLNF